jgi:hypothetical protein
MRSLSPPSRTTQGRIGVRMLASDRPWNRARHRPSPSRTTRLSRLVRSRDVVAGMARRAEQTHPTLSRHRPGRPTPRRSPIRVTASTGHRGSGHRYSRLPKGDKSAEAAQRAGGLRRKCDRSRGSAQVTPFEISRPAPLRLERVQSWWSTRYHSRSASRFISSLVAGSHTDQHLALASSSHASAGRKQEGRGHGGSDHG